MLICLSYFGSFSKIFLDVKVRPSNKCQNAPLNPNQRRCKMASENRRRFPRKNEEAEIQVLIPPTHSQDPEGQRISVPVRMYNQSQSGLYFEIDRALEIGSNVSIKMVAPEKDSSEDAHFIYDGQVQWCKKVDDKPSRFGVGVKIHSKVVRAEVLTSRLGGLA